MCLPTVCLVFQVDVILKTHAHVTVNLNRHMYINHVFHNSAVLMRCNFDDDDYAFSTDGNTDGCQLQRRPGTGMDWLRQEYTTTSTETGPDNDHTSGTGGYIYTEASNPANTGDEAVVYTPVFTVDAGCRLTIEFYYSMYGADIGELRVQETDSQTVLWSLSGQQHSDGSTWSLASISLPFDSTARDVQFDFVGVKGNDYRGDIAIDDLVISQECPCESGWSYLEETDRCYKHFDYYVQYDNAVTICGEEGGLLASVNSQQQQDHLASLSP